MNKLNRPEMREMKFVGLLLCKKLRNKHIVKNIRTCDKNFKKIKYQEKNQLNLKQISKREKSSAVQVSIISIQMVQAKCQWGVRFEKRDTGLKK